MCCIFTCCGWMVDLLQRVWTFSMSCIIMSSVMGVLTTASMSGIALGYNYSLSEYIELKETNVSVYLKRGVFDDEIADDMEWRRAGHLPVAGQINEDNLMTGGSADETTTLRSGRRLDDSVFESDDQNKYEGSLMKLTARPLHEDLPTQVTGDMEMGEELSKYTGSLDQMKAIQSLIDSRRAMATGGTTLSPLATYASALPLIPYLPKENNPNMHPDVQYRRTMGPLAHPDLMYEPTTVNPARFAVPETSLLGDRTNWLAPKYPEAFMHTTIDTLFYSKATYPTAITVRPMLVRPTPKEVLREPDGAVVFPYLTGGEEKRKSTQLPPIVRPSGQDSADNKPDFYNEKVLLEGDELSKIDNSNVPKGWKSPEEEYEDEIKGLPVRRRRSIIVNTLVGKGRNPLEYNNKVTTNNDYLTSVKNIFTSLTTNKELDSEHENTFTVDKNNSVSDVNNDSNTVIDDFNNTDTIIDGGDKDKINQNNKLENNVVMISGQDRNENKKGLSLLEHLVTSIKNKESSLTTAAVSTGIIDKDIVQDIKVKTISSSFENTIVPTKYVENNLATRLENKQPSNNKGILDSLRIAINKGEFFKNPGSSSLLKVFKSVLTT